MRVPEIVAEICTTTTIMRLYHTLHLDQNNSSNGLMRDKDQEVGVDIILRIIKEIDNMLIHNNIVIVSLNLVATEIIQIETDGIEITQNEEIEEIEIIV